MSISELIQLDGRLLTTFCVVAQELHFGRAARRLNISQPPLSQQIKRLEALVGTALFERTTRSVALTPAGVTMYRHASQICSDMLTMLETTRQSAQGVKGALKIGLAPTAGHTPVVQALRDYRQQHPDIVLSLREMNSVDMPAALQDRELDVAFMRPFATSLELDMPCVHEEPFGLVTRHDDFAGGSGISLKEVAKLPLIGYEADASPYFRQLLGEMFQRHDLRPRIVQESRLPTILTLVEAGVGQAVVPWSLARLHQPTLTFVPIHESQGVHAKLVMATSPGHANPALPGFAASMLTRLA